MERNLRLNSCILMVGILFSTLGFSNPINDYYKAHKTDLGMEAKTIPPKIAALWIDDDYTEAKEILKSFTTLKYLDFEGEHNKIRFYVKNAILAKGKHKQLLEDANDDRKIIVFGVEKKGVVRKLMAVVETKTRFILVIGKGKLSKTQLKLFPDLAKEL